MPTSACDRASFCLPCHCPPHLLAGATAVINRKPLLGQPARQVHPSPREWLSPQGSVQCLQLGLGASVSPCFSPPPNTDIARPRGSEGTEMSSGDLPGRPSPQGKRSASFFYSFNKHILRIYYAVHSILDPSRVRAMDRSLPLPASQIQNKSINVI